MNGIFVDFFFFYQNKLDHTSELNIFTSKWNYPLDSQDLLEKGHLLGGHS